MGVKNVKLGSTLSFDEAKEKDIIQKVEYLTSRHKLGEFISHLIRIALESPEKMKSHQALDGMLGELLENGVSQDRAEYFKKLSEEVSVMKDKVDAVYRMAEMNYNLALMGKRLGIEDKAENTLRAQFVLQRQISQLNELLGDSLYGTYESNKIEDVKKKSDEVMQHIIDSYDGILSEIKGSISTGEVKETKEVKVKAVKEVKIEEVIPETKPQVEEIQEPEDEEEEIIDFGMADVGALSGFFGED